ncbi:hypothetical protein ACLMJK_006639 [Lecanora helva]
MGPSSENNLSPSPPSSHSSNDADASSSSTSSAPRPKPYTAATVIPALHPLETSQSHHRSRAQSASVRQSLDFSPRQRAGTTLQHRPAPLDVERATLPAVRPSSPQRLASLPDVLAEKPSSPIPIPQRQKPKSPPITPLTARAHSPITFFGRTKPRPHISESLTPHYTTSAPKLSASQPAPSDPVVQTGFAAMGPRPGSPLHGYTPTSPLSPTMQAQSLSGSRRLNQRRPAVKMNLPGLPKFHPANYPTQAPSSVVPSPRHTRSTSSQSRPARGSDAQQQLHQYQRDLIQSATQSSRSFLSEAISTKPDSPRLTPMRSPVDPMTPLALEARSDYLTARSGSPTSSWRDGGGREMVERLVRRENERRNHPEARSGSVSPGLSPAVSPVGGRG